jgi:hypothetical protein
MMSSHGLPVSVLPAHNPKGLPGAASTSQLDSTVACSVREHPLHSILSNAQESTYGNTLSNIACVETSRVFGTVA